MRWTPKAKIYSEWKPWFAWRPVRGQGSNTWFWLETIERKGEYACDYFFWYYRAPR